MAETSIKIRESTIVKTHWQGLTRQYKTFEGRKLVEFLLSEHIASDRKSAIRMGRALLEADFIHEIDHSKHFTDTTTLYRLKIDDSEILPGPSAPLATGCCINFGWVTKKRTSPTRWRKRFLVLLDKDLYWYKGELSPSPKGRSVLSQCKIDVEKCHECKKNMYSFHLSDNGRRIHVCCDNPREHV